MITLRVVEPEPIGLGVANAEVNPVLTHNHAELTNLDYEHSGHTGFASLAGLTEETSARQTADGELSIAVNAKYTKPPGGIPKSDLSSDVKSSLNKADSALQEHVKSDWNATSGDAEILNKPTVQSVSVSDSGSSTNEVRYITIDGIEKKLAGGGATGFEINSSGHLIISSTSQTEASAYSIDESGHLIINL